MTHAGRGELERALHLLEDALNLIDRAEAAFDVGAYLDLAVHRLKATLGVPEKCPWPQLEADLP
jgi:hypothetical protein